jgi:hypothetical protein
MTNPDQLDASTLAMDARIANSRLVFEQMRTAVDQFRNRLVASGFTPHRVMELRHDGSGITVATGYAGGEFWVRVSDRAGLALMPMFRVWPGGWAAKPDGLDRLAITVQALVTSHKSDRGDRIVP